MTGHVSYIETIADVPFTEECLVIADERLPDFVLRSLPDPVLVKSGEGLKSLASIERLAETVLQRRATRPLTLVAVGGGTVGDAVGFLASILWRGVGLWQVPTTLLAMVDSAHGGKTAVNLPHAKNQIGSFYPAGQIFIVTDILKELPMHVRREGLSELLKTFLLSSEEPFEHLQPFEDLAFEPWEHTKTRLIPLVKTAIRIKQSIVKQDPFEKTGVRTLLNLGHTFGHALERTAGIPHGTAVAWGLAAMLEVSRAQGLPEREARQAQSQLYPLLTPLTNGFDQEALVRAMLSDKKRTESRLRSVVLENLRRPKLTEKVTELDWLEAFGKAKKAFLESPVTVSIETPHDAVLNLSAGKSELTRALVIAALRQGETAIRGASTAGDVKQLYRALRQLGFGIEQTAGGYRSLRNRDPHIPEHTPTVHCGEGAAPFRFLLALAASMQRETILLADAQLLGRPHDPLIHALRSAGASIEPYRSNEGMGYRVRGWETAPKSFSVDASLSSQYVSALALLSAGADAPYTIRLESEPVSAPYLDMTLEMLRKSGVEVLRQGALIACNPTSALASPLELAAEPDASSAAVWRVAQYLGHPVTLANAPPKDSTQPDARVEEYLSAIDRAVEGAGIDLADAPDLLPALVVAAIRKGVPVHFTGIERLQHKESDRIDGFAGSLRGIGIPMERTGGGLRSPHAAEVRFTPGAAFHTLGDHRLVMAGALLSMLLGPLTLDAPWSVTKSYPDFWDHAREAGWRMKNM